MIRQNLIIIAAGAVILLAGGALMIFDKNTPSGNSGMNSLYFAGELGQTIPDTQNGIHYHPELSIYIKGQKQEVPSNVGIGWQYSNSRFYDGMMQMADIHTHDNSGVLHWEVMQGPVKKGYLRLGNFFEIWGRDFSSNQIFGQTSGSGGTVKMFVNGQPNEQFENYLVSDKDKIEIRYE